MKFLRTTTLNLDERLVRLARVRGINLSAEIRDFMVKRLGVDSDPEDVEGLKTELMIHREKLEEAEARIKKILEEQGKLEERIERQKNKKKSEEKPENKDKVRL